MDPNNSLAETLLAQAAEAAARAAAARIDLPPPVPRRLHLPRRHGHRALPARPGDHPRLCLAVPEGPAREHARLRHRRPRLPQPGDRHRGGLRGLGRRPARRTGWARSSTPCPTTWASAPTRTPGGTTCWRTARPRATAPTSTSPGGPRPARSSRTRSCSRSWATPTATSSRPASSRWPSPTGRSRSTTTTAASRWPRAATASVLGHRLDELERHPGPRGPRARRISRAS